MLSPAPDHARRWILCYVFGAFPDAVVVGVIRRLRAPGGTASTPYSRVALSVTMTSISTARALSDAAAHRLLVGSRIPAMAAMAQEHSVATSRAPVKA